MKTITVTFRLLLMVLLLPLMCFTKNITKEQAAALAVQFFKAGIEAKHLDLTTEISNIQTFNHEDIPVLYVVNFKNGGYVLTPADDSFYPVLAYSFENSFSEAELPPNVQSWLDWYSSQIVAGINKPDKCFENHALLWDNFDEAVKDLFSEEETGVGPLSISKWDQKDYYNEMCPTDPAGFGGHSPVGCVATAMSQLMYYYRFPPVGEGSNSYIPPYHNGIYGEQFADFGNTFYRWDEMQDQCLQSNQAVAELCYHCGVSVNMAYQPANAGASTSDIPSALINYFNYAPSAYYQDRAELGSTTKWLILLLESLDKGQPVLYRSTNGWAGHAYVCDGYQDSLYYHFNWGWSGNYNGYFYIEELIPGGINISYGHGAVFGIYPDTTQFDYPVFCEGTKVLTSKLGTIEDGSGPDNYLPNTSCNWLIQPADTSLTNMVLDFLFLDTEADTDIISIYDGPDAEAELLGEFSGNEIPGTINASSNTVFVTFQCDDANENTGWKLSYYAYRLPFCDELFVVSDLDGVFDDGSKHLFYAGNADCSWLIAPQVPLTDSVDHLNLHFDVFSVAPDDTLFVYDGDNETMPLLGKFSGWGKPPDIISSGNKVYINFKTNNGWEGPGWAISYNSVIPDYCKNTVWLSGQSGVIEDGSGAKNYVENTDCSWVIDVPNADFIVLDFMEVDLEEFYDNVKVSDMNNLNQYIERITGHEPYPPFTVNSNRVLLRFTSDDRDNFGGWLMAYHASVEGIEEDCFNKLLINPNPFSDFITIKSDINSGNLSYSVYDIHGEEVISGSFQKNNQTNINVKKLNNGVYFIRISDGEFFETRKIIKN
jgi:hypothetical protein